MIELLFFIIFFFALLVPLSYLLGKFISVHFIEDEITNKTKWQKIFDAIEKPIFKFCNINPKEKVSAKKYLFVLLWSNLVLSIICFFALYFQNISPYKGNVTTKLDIPLILHIISSLITNTCQTHHTPELHLTHFSNFFILPLLMFYSSASGIAVGIMFMRGIAFGKIGNPYSDIVKAMTRILFPICFIIALIFSALGIPNTFKSSITYNTLENIKETIILGPVATFEAIKLIGENGQSCFNANSAHPFENPSYLSNYLELISILLIPFALIITFGFWLKNHKQSMIILSALLTILLFEFIVISGNELNGNSTLNSTINKLSPNWVGKETRFGIIGSSIFEAAVSNVSGAANSSLESFHPIAVAISLFNLSNQAIFGVQGFGLVFTLNAILYTSFFVGLMLGKTPQVFGKKIEKNEIILSSILILINPFIVLLGVAFTLITHPIESLSFYDHVHYFTRVFYEFASGAASNGSGLEGLNDNTPYWNISLSISMLIARYAAMASMIALGSSLAYKATVPETVATFKTDTILFGFIFIFISVTATLLIYLPFIILSPISELLIKK